MSSLQIGVDLTLGDDHVAQNINLTSHGGFVFVPVDSGNVTITNSTGALGLVTVDLNINSTAALDVSLNGGNGNNSLVFEGFDASTGLLSQPTNWTISGFSNNDASAVEGVAGFGLALGLVSSSSNLSGGAQTAALIAANNSLYHNETGKTLIGSHGSDLLVGGHGNDSLVSTSGHDTLIGNGGNDTFVIMPATGTHSDTIDMLGGHTYGSNAAGTTFTSVADTGATIDISNFGDFRLAFAGFERDSAGDLVAVLAQDAGGGTVTVEGYYGQAAATGALLIGQDTVNNGNGNDQATFALASTANGHTITVGSGVLDTNNYLLVGTTIGGDVLTANASDANFYFGGGHGDTFTDSVGHGKATFSLYDSIAGTTDGLLVDLSHNGTGDLVYDLSGTLATSLAGSVGSLTSSGLHAFESANLGTANLLATMNGIEQVTGTAGNDIFIGPASGSHFVQFQGDGGNNTYVNLDPGVDMVGVRYDSAPMLTARDANGNVVFEGGVVVNLDGAAHSFGGGSGVTIAADHAFNGWGGTDTFIGNISDIVGSANNDIVWAARRGSPTPTRAATIRSSVPSTPITRSTIPRIPAAPLAAPAPPPWPRKACAST